MGLISSLGLESTTTWFYNQGKLINLCINGGKEVFLLQHEAKGNAVYKTHPSPPNIQLKTSKFPFPPLLLYQGIPAGFIWKENSIENGKSWKQKNSQPALSTKLWAPWE